MNNATKILDFIQVRSKIFYLNGYTYSLIFSSNILITLFCSFHNICEYFKSKDVLPYLNEL